ncbi:Hpt domain-containing protein [Xylophilus sp.]|uniref:Hpt domain-containing protein n=1 Tax=Xylophilus sp. TaxID=2653893 RepID=UPI0013B974A7|nr:Hpt domain-containing protein [Xylophilus sp.]KAF1049005.1 MAG: hypothetical protein GAK38_01120 [Xylophilus sp.]
MLRRALGRFIAEQRGGARDGLLADAGAARHEAAQLGAHRLRGAAANLGLAEVQALAQQAEQAFEDGAAQRARDALEALRGALAAVEQAFAARPLPQPPGAAAAAIGAGGTVDLAALARAADATLSRGELDDELLAQLDAGLRAAGHAALAAGIARSAEVFDFERARSLLRGWMKA